MSPTSTHSPRMICSPWEEWGGPGQKLLKSIETSKACPLSKLLFGLGIRHVGEHTAKLLARNFGSLDNLAKAEPEQLKQIHEIGETVADSVIDYFNDPAKQLLLDKLDRAGVVPKGEDRIPHDGLFSGKTVVFTGSLTLFTRQDAEQQVEQFGGRAAKSVSKNRLRRSRTGSRKQT